MSTTRMLRATRMTVHLVPCKAQQQHSDSCRPVPRFAARGSATYVQFVDTVDQYAAHHLTLSIPCDRCFILRLNSEWLVTVKAELRIVAPRIRGWHPPPVAPGSPAAAPLRCRTPSGSAGATLRSPAVLAAQLTCRGRRPRECSAGCAVPVETLAMDSCHCAGGK